jgi:hypothetical protein
MNRSIPAASRVVLIIVALAVLPGTARGAATAIDGGALAPEDAGRIGSSLEAVDPASRPPERVVDPPMVTPYLVPDHIRSVRGVSPGSGSEMLKQLEPELRANALIELEPFGDLDQAHLLQAADVENLWNAGRHREAVERLDELEASGSIVAVGLSWKRPIVIDTKMVYPDVRIGSRTGGAAAALDFDAETGNIFAMIVWSVGWSMNISTDGGASWAETYYYSVFQTIADMTVSGDFAWVGYSADGDAYQSSRFRRFDVATGLHDDVYSFQIVADEAPNTMVEIAVVGNAPDYNDRIYMAYLLDEDHTIHFWWATLAGTSFAEVSPAVADAASSLDLCWNSATSSGYRRWISYLSTGGSVRIWRSSGDAWNPEVSWTFTGVGARTAISAYADNVYCAFECESDPGMYGACYLTSADAGVTSWLYDDAYWPTGTEVSGYSPDITVRSGVGRALVFSSETGALDDVYYTTRRGWTAGPWSDPAWYNTYDHVSGEATYIEWLGASCVSTFGMLYFDGVGDHSPYFDLMTPRGYFCDGFEGGSYGGWSSVLP